MKKNYLIGIILIVITLLTAWLINMGYLLGEEEPNTQINAQLQIDLTECIAIAEKSVAHMKAVVEFQQLEIIGRKACVMRNCMQDHQYVQNEQWTQFANPIAKTRAEAEHISFDEAFETLRRDHMVKLTPSKHNPPFWIAKKQP